MATSIPSELNEANSVEGNVITLKSYLEDTRCVDRMCNDYVALLQMAREVELIHSKNEGHGEIKPENITIREDKNGVIFQLTASKLKSRNIDNSLSDDVSDLGFVFIQYLAKRLSLNPKEPNETNVQRLADWKHWAVDVVQNMINKESGERPTMKQVVERLAHPGIFSVPEAEEHRILRLTAQKRKIGQSIHHVYRGKFMDQDVAIKRILKDTSELVEREVRSMMHLEHKNVLQLFYADKDEVFFWLALELCDGNLSQLCRNELDIGELVIDNRDGLVQMAKGLEYIHGQKLVHRDVKPDNILVKCSSGLVYKISDFGHTKKTSDEGSHSLSEVRGTKKYYASEQLNEQLSFINGQQSSDTATRGTIASDVFALGIVFHFFLPSSNGRRGKHPFEFKGSSDIERNIRNGKFKLTVKEPWAKFIVKNMIQKEPNSRPKLTGILHCLRFAAVKSTIVHKIDCYRERAMKNAEKFVFGCAFDYAGNQLACALNFGKLAIFQGSPPNSDVPFNEWSYSVALPPASPGKQITKLAWNVEGNQIAASSDDGTVLIVWKRSVDKCIKSYSQTTDSQLDPCSHMGTWNSHRPKLLTSGTISGDRFVSDVSDPKLESEIQIKDIVWVNSQHLVTRTSDDKIKLWIINPNLSTSVKHQEIDEEIIRIFRNQKDQQPESCFLDETPALNRKIADPGIEPGPHCVDRDRRSANKSEMVAFSGENKALKRFVLNSGNQNVSELEIVKKKSTNVTCAIQSPNGQYLAELHKHTSGYKIIILFMDSISVQRVFQHKFTRKFSPKSLIWSPTSQKLAIANQSRRVVVLDIPPEP